MKAIAIESSFRTISFTAGIYETNMLKNSIKKVSLVLDTGVQHSENLIPSVDIVLRQLDIQTADLDFIAVSKGPGSFTGLRLAFSLAKALQLASNIPLYAVPTLDIFAYPYKTYPAAVLSVLDAKKNRFYTSVFRAGKPVTQPLDVSCMDIAQYIDSEEKVLIVGPDRFLYAEELQLIKPNLDIRTNILEPISSESLLELARIYIENGIMPLEDYDGPLYIRKSEAEENK